ncbi:L-tyrosine/L-tryptophan isonitrile synthase family protein [Streptomyces sp. NPDC021100]|uniref:L-tyrosine/L-tryptophan isonitrile synthase family protein n=1 Tax=Streptomyces sp. NPDC021100 TaxID=3365114 RepID=UPI00379B27CC
MPATTPSATESLTETAHAVLSQLLPHRRTIEPDPENDTTHDFPHQIRQISHHLERRQPILFSLPGFPCKSPNTAKVISHLPDEGERLALHFLQDLCTGIEKIYSPGARVLICSDGHIFGDVIGVPDEHIDAYGDALRTMIQEEGLDHLGTFDLRDVYGPDLDYDEKRRMTADRYAPTVEQLRAEVKTDESTLRMYRGITRFLVEDTPDWTGSKAALQRQSRQRAYHVIARSRAWASLIADYHQDTVRLSIHPQNRNEAKYGIKFLDTTNPWTTPWHATLLKHPDGFQLVHHTRAAELGEPVRENGRVTHYRTDLPMSTQA